MGSNPKSQVPNPNHSQIPNPKPNYQIPTASPELVAIPFWNLEVGSGWSLGFGIWDLATTLNPPHNSLSRLTRPERAPDVLRHLMIANRAEHGGIDCGGCIRQPQRLEHQRRRSNRANR